MDAKAKKKKKQEEKGVMEIREQALKRALATDVDVDTSSFLAIPTVEQAKSIFSVFKYIRKVHDETEDLWTTDAEPDSAIVEKITYGHVFSIDDLGGGKHEIHAVCKAVLTFLEGCAPLIDYRVVKLTLNLTRTVEEYKKVINNEVSFIISGTPISFAHLLTNTSLRRGIRSIKSSSSTCLTTGSGFARRRYERRDMSGTRMD